MKIRSSVAPTPIVSMTVSSNHTDSQPSAPALPPPIQVETEPMTVDLGSKMIELQPGELAKVVEKVNQTAQVFSQSLQFQMGEGKQIVIRVVDTVSGQVVREIPPERFMDAFKRMQDALGLLLDLRL